MTTSSINHRRAPYAAAATGLVGTLFAVTALNSAYAMPGPDDRPTVPGRTVQTHGHYVEHSCFIRPHTWNGALAGPLPRCYTYVP